ncbi:hypothetical protein PIB30_049984 [Stylosanthes scabra]|uniref:Aminotransferase-like plant mobile domain-containing protein n=1 Tax=Stylosanthes scabra TaxID=79078 RepID=A0ABU6RI91_9FABA|nr:hypothetical protein [Stylosanthes scabra]
MLAVMLHKKQYVSLANLILGQLYESLTLVVETIHQGQDSFNPFGPLWVADLWLKAIFRPRIPRSVANFPKKAINGIRLTLLEKPESPYEFETFCSFFPWFFYLREDLEAYGDEVWAHTLIPQKLRALPSPSSFNPEDQLVKYEIDYTDELAQAIEATEERAKSYQRFSNPVRCCYSTKSFDDWWSNYFSSHCPPFEQVLANLGLHSVVQSAPLSKKSKVQWKFGKRKKVAYEDLSFEKYLKANAINPFISRELFMRPFQYPPFPNAQFGIADRLPDPAKGSRVTRQAQLLILKSLSSNRGPTKKRHPRKIKAKRTLVEQNHLIFEYTSLGHEANPVLISSSCPVSASTATATYSSLALPQHELITITSPIREINVEDEGPFTVPTPEADDLAFADDKFNLDSILSEVQEVFLSALQKTSSENPEAEGTLSLPSNENQKEDTEIVASAEIKAQLLEATSFLNHHASSEVSSLESFMEDLFNNNALLETRSEDLRLATAELSKHKKEVAKYGKALSKVKPLVEMGTNKEKEAESIEQAQLLRVEQLEKELSIAKQALADTQAGLAKIKATNLSLKDKMAEFEQKQSSNNSKCVAALKAIEEAEAKHKQAIEASTKLNKRQEELKLAFRFFLK